MVQEECRKKPTRHSGVGMLRAEPLEMVLEYPPVAQMQECGKRRGRDCHSFSSGGSPVMWEGKQDFWMAEHRVLTKYLHLFPEIVTIQTLTVGERQWLVEQLGHIGSWEQ